MHTPATTSVPANKMQTHMSHARRGEEAAMRSIQLLRGTRSVTANGSVGFPFASASHAKKIGARAHSPNFSALLRYGTSTK
eukprot:scaffold82666_cov61-Phaeocystis_antarctica.AAC.4